MLPSRFSLLCLSAAALLSGGCATTSPRTAFSEVRSQIAKRSDLPTPTWPITSKERTASSTQVQQLLTAGLTVNSAVHIALLNNRSLSATFEELGLSQAALSAATRLPNPSLSASLRWPHTLPHSPNAEFGLSLPLLDALLLSPRKKIARETLLQTQYQVSHAILELTGKVRQAAYEVLAEQAEQKRLQQIVDADKAASAFAQKQFDAGNISRLDLLRMRAAASQIQVELVRHTADLQFAREQLNRLLGLTPGQTDWQLVGGLPLPPATDKLPDHLETLAQSSRLDLAARRAQATLAVEKLSLERKTRWLPGGVTLGADTERESSGDRLSGPNLSLELPLFNQGQPELARKEALVRQASNQAAALAIEVASETRAAHARLIAARQADQLYQKELLPTFRAAFQQALLHYNAMDLNVYELLDARSKALRVELEAISARRDYWQARVGLERAVGRRLPLPAASPSTTDPDTEAPEPPSPTHTHSHHH